MERTKLISDQTLPPIGETYRLHGKTAGYAFVVKVEGVSCLISVVTQPYANYVQEHNEHRPEELWMDNQFYVLKEEVTIQNPQAAFAELAQQPDELIRLLLEPADPVFEEITKD